MQLVKAGKLKAIAVASAQRISSLPEVPTLVESGFPKVVSGSWQAIFVPAGTPRAVVEKLHAALVAAFDTADVRQKLAIGGAIVVTSRTPEDFQAFVDAEVVKWGQVAREAGVTAE